VGVNVKPTTKVRTSTYIFTFFLNKAGRRRGPMITVEIGALYSRDITIIYVFMMDEVSRIIVLQI
jgi:hypothetical protein